MKKMLIATFVAIFAALFFSACGPTEVEKQAAEAMRTRIVEAKKVMAKKEAIMVEIEQIHTIKEATGSLPAELQSRLDNLTTTYATLPDYDEETLALIAAEEDKANPAAYYSAATSYRNNHADDGSNMMYAMLLSSNGGNMLMNYALLESGTSPLTVMMLNSFSSFNSMDNNSLRDENDRLRRELNSTRDAGQRRDLERRLQVLEAEKQNRASGRTAQGSFKKKVEEVKNLKPSSTVASYRQRAAATEAKNPNLVPKTRQAISATPPKNGRSGFFGNRSGSGSSGKGVQPKIRTTQPPKSGSGGGVKTLKPPKPPAPRRKQ